MKIKKILAGVSAGVLAFSSLASMSLISSNAVETTFNIFKGSQSLIDFKSNKKSSLIVDPTTIQNFSRSFINGDSAKLVIKWTKENNTEDADVAGQYDAVLQPAVKAPCMGLCGDEDCEEEWCWTELAKSINIEGDNRLDAGKSGTYTFNIDNTVVENGDGGSITMIDALKSVREFDLKGKNIIINSVDLVCDYTAPAAFEKWIDNGDGSFTWVASKKGSPDSATGKKDSAKFKLTSDILPIDDYSAVRTISFTVKSTDWATLSLGASAPDQSWLDLGGEGFKFIGSPDPDNPLEARWGTTQTVTLNTPEGICDSSVPEINISYINAQCVLTISDFKLNGKAIRSFNAVAGEGGSISCDKSNGKYYTGEKFSLSATPENGYEFANWSDGTNVVSTEPNFNYELPDKNVTLTANFRNPELSWSFATAVIGGGDITSTPGDGTYDDATTIVLTATAKTGNRFVNWTGANGEVVSEEPNFTYTLKSNTVLTANFEEIKYSFSVNSTEGGMASFKVKNTANCPDGTKQVDISALDQDNWLLEQRGVLAKRILKGGEQDNAVWTDNSGNETLAKVKSITITVSGVDDSKLATTGGLAFSLSGDPDKNWLQGTWKVNVKGDNDPGVTVKQVGKYYNITFTPTVDELFTMDELNKENSCVVIALQNYGNSDDKTSPDYVVKGLSINDADGNALYSEGQIATDDKFAPGTEFEISAVAESGYQFVNWTDAKGNEVSKNAKDSYTLGDADTVLTAHFVKVENSSSTPDSKLDSSSKTDDSKNDSSIREIDTSSKGSNSNASSNKSGSNTSGGNDSSPNTGAAAALILSGMAIAGAAVIVSKKKK